MEKIIRYCRFLMFVVVLCNSMTCMAAGSLFPEGFNYMPSTTMSPPIPTINFVMPSSSALPTIMSCVAASLSVVCIAWKWQIIIGGVTAAGAYAVDKLYKLFNRILVERIKPVNEKLESLTMQAKLIQGNLGLIQTNAEQLEKGQQKINEDIFKLQTLVADHNKLFSESLQEIQSQCSALARQQDDQAQTAGKVSSKCDELITVLSKLAIANNEFFDNTTKSMNQVMNNAKLHETAVGDMQKSFAEFAIKMNEFQGAVQGVNAAVDEANSNVQQVQAQVNEIATELDCQNNIIKQAYEAAKNQLVQCSDTLFGSVTQYEAMLEKLQNTLLIKISDDQSSNATKIQELSRDLQGVKDSSQEIDKQLQEQRTDTGNFQQDCSEQLKALISRLYKVETDMLTFTSEFEIQLKDIERKIVNINDQVKNSGDFFNKSMARGFVELHTIIATFIEARNKEDSRLNRVVAAQAKIIRKQAQRIRVLDSVGKVGQYVVVRKETVTPSGQSLVLEQITQKLSQINVKNVFVHEITY